MSFLSLILLNKGGETDEYVLANWLFVIHNRRRMLMMMMTIELGLGLFYSELELS